MVPTNLRPGQLRVRKNLSSPDCRLLKAHNCPVLLVTYHFKHLFLGRSGVGDGTVVVTRNQRKFLKNNNV